ncbi:hypothetical protein ACO0LM_18410 [Undibacterium sp. Di26W]|uniref:hypothetical protein n=1 Tax=Undibacterium sp. Di26W TaxID=3413035 RepID=UPI003BF09968
MADEVAGWGVEFVAEVGVEGEEIGPIIVLSLLRRLKATGLASHRAGAPAALFLCRTLIEAIALRRAKPGLGPAAEFLSLLRQRTESKKGDRRLALRVLTLRFSIICASQKMGKLRNSLRSNTKLSDPFSVTHKLHRPKRMRVKDNLKNNCNSKVKTNVNTTVFTFI